VNVLGSAGAQAETYAQILDDLNNSAGKTEQAFATVSDTLEFKLGQLQSSLGAVAIEIGYELMPAFTEMVDMSGDVVEFWDRLPEPVKESAVRIGAAGSAMSLFTGALLMALPRMAEAVTSFRNLWRSSMLFRSSLVGAGGLMAAVLVLPDAIDALGKSLRRAFASMDDANRKAAELRVQFEGLGGDALVARLLPALQNLSGELASLTAKSERLEQQGLEGIRERALTTEGALEGLRTAGSMLGGVFDWVTRNSFDLGGKVETTAEKIGELEEQIAALIVVAKDLGLTFPQIMSLLQQSGIDASSGIIKDALEPMRQAFINSQPLLDGWAQNFVHNMDTGKGAAMSFSVEVRQRLLEVGTKFQEFRAGLDTVMEEIGDTLTGILPSVDETFDEWRKRLDEMAQAYINFEDNLRLILGRLVEANVENPELIIRALEEAGPLVTAAMAKHLGENPVAATNEVLQDLSIIASTNIREMTDAVLRETPAWREQMRALGLAGETGFQEGIGNPEAWGMGLVDGIKAGILNKQQELLLTAFGLAQQTAEEIRAGFGEFWPMSPSEAGIKVGKGLLEGLAVAIRDRIDIIRMAIAEVRQEIANTIDPALKTELIAKMQALLAELTRELSLAMAELEATATGGTAPAPSAPAPPEPAPSAALPGPAPVPAPIIQGLLDATDALRAQQAGLYDLADAILNIVAGIPTAVDALQLQRAGFNELAQLLLEVIAGLRPLSDIVAMQYGGIVNRPTLALLGEAGPEAVLPLRALSQQTIHLEITVQAIDADSFRRIMPTLVDELRLELDRRMM